MNAFRAHNEGVNVAAKLDRQCIMYQNYKSRVSGHSDNENRVVLQKRVHPGYNFNT